MRHAKVGLPNLSCLRCCRNACLQPHLFNYYVPNLFSYSGLITRRISPNSTKQIWRLQRL